MMRKLRNRFHGLYTDYGCKLWTIYIVQAISLLLLSITSILDYYSDTWNTFWRTNSVFASIWDMLLNIFCWIIPMIA